MREGCIWLIALSLSISSIYKDYLDLFLIITIAELIIIFSISEQGSWNRKFMARKKCRHMVCEDIAIFDLTDITEIIVAHIIDVPSIRDSVTINPYTGSIAFVRFVVNKDREWIPVFIECLFECLQCHTNSPFSIPSYVPLLLELRSVVLLR